MNYTVCQRLKLELLKSQIEINNIEVYILKVDKKIYRINKLQISIVNVFVEVRLYIRFFIYILNSFIYMLSLLNE